MRSQSAPTKTAQVSSFMKARQCCGSTSLRWIHPRPLVRAASSRRALHATRLMIENVGLLEGGSGRETVVISIRDQDLREAFSPHGNLLSASVVTDRESGPMKPRPPSQL